MWRAHRRSGEDSGALGPPLGPYGLSMRVERFDVYCGGPRDGELDFRAIIWRSDVSSFLPPRATHMDLLRPSGDVVAEIDLFDVAVPIGEYVEIVADSPTYSPGSPCTLCAVTPLSPLGSRVWFETPLGTMLATSHVRPNCIWSP